MAAAYIRIYIEQSKFKTDDCITPPPFQAYLRGTEIYHRQRRAHEIFYCPTDIFVLKYSAWRQERQKLNSHGRRHLTVVPVMEIPENRGMETYRSGHNELDSKSSCPQGHVGSNPTVSAKETSYPFRVRGF